MDARYSVYRSGTDEPVYIYGTRVQCAKAMKISVKSFDCYASWQKSEKARKIKKWIIVKEEVTQDGD